MSIVLHVDMDCFYASVELRRRPELRGSPVVVGGPHRGVVLSATYEARAFGVRSGMSGAQAGRLCPQATFLSPDFEAYTDVSRSIVAVFETFTSAVDAVSIDEAFLDVTSSVRRLGAPERIGEQIRARVADEQQITCSVGIGPSRFVAKVASREAKPDGLLAVAPDQVLAFLHPLPVEKMWGVGPATAAKLHAIGVFTVADLAATGRSGLQRAFGRHSGAVLHALAQGRDARPVMVRPPERSIGSQETFGRDTTDAADVKRELLRMAAKSAARMRKAALVGRTVTLSVRFADFTSVTRSVTLSTPTDVTGEIHAAAVGLYDQLGLDRARVRRVGVRVEGLVAHSAGHRQPLLTEPEFGWPEAEAAVDRAVSRFGPRAVQRAALTTRHYRSGFGDAGSPAAPAPLTLPGPSLPGPDAPGRDPSGLP